MCEPAPRDWPPWRFRSRPTVQLRSSGSAAPSWRRSAPRSSSLTDPVRRTTRWTAGRSAAVGSVQKPGSNLGSFPGDRAGSLRLTERHGRLTNSEPNHAPCPRDRQNSGWTARGTNTHRRHRLMETVLRRARDVYKRQLFGDVASLTTAWRAVKATASLELRRIPKAVAAGHLRNPEMPLLTRYF